MEKENYKRLGQRAKSTPHGFEPSISRVTTLRQNVSLVGGAKILFGIYRRAYGEAPNRQDKLKKFSNKNSSILFNQHDHFCRVWFGGKNNKHLPSQLNSISSKNLFKSSSVPIQF